MVQVSKNRRIAAIAVLSMTVLLLDSCVHAPVGSPADIKAPPSLIASLPSVTSVVTNASTVTATPSISPEQAAMVQTRAAGQATFEAINATEAVVLPKCGGSMDRSVSPMGNWVAVRCVNYGLGVYNRTNPSKAYFLSYYDLRGSLFNTGDRFGNVRSIHWGADGDSLYFSASPLQGDGGCSLGAYESWLFKLDLFSGRFARLADAVSAFLPEDNSLSFSSGDVYLAFVSRRPDNRIILVSLDLSGHKTTELALGKDVVSAFGLVWSPDNQRILLSAETGETCENISYRLVLVDLRNQNQKILINGDFFPVSWDEGERVLLEGGSSDHLFYVDVSSGAITAYSGPTLTPTP
jgi:hypothetical protein